ncbi:MAG: helix-hairpin-helix domain-containing protein [Planctomycetaceae bacterium]|nr:helix-hairpin-helix domain-containing protein [Planctomycetaceae bacterium]
MTEPPLPQADGVARPSDLPSCLDANQGQQQTTAVPTEEHASLTSLANSHQTERGFPLLSASDQQFARWFLIIFLSIFAIEWVWLKLQHPVPLEVERSPEFHELFSVDINTATWVDWIQLEGIGQTLAHRIVADRKINGPFQSVDELQRVSGIGPKTLERLRPWLRCSFPPNPESEPADDEFEE